MGEWQFHYRIADCVLSATGEDAELGALAASLYESARCAEAPPQTHFCLRRRSDALVLESAGCELEAADSLAEFFPLVEWRLTEAFMRGLAAFYQVHAAVAVYRGRALLLSGPPDAGKTSLLVGLALSGAEIQTDEIALIDGADLRVHPFPRDLIIHRGTQRVFPEIAIDLPAWKVFPEYCFLPPSAFSAGIAKPVPCGEVVFPVHRSGAKTSLRSLGQAEAASRLLEQSFTLWDWGEAGIELVGRLVEACPARELVFADAREAVAHLLASEVQR